MLKNQPLFISKVINSLLIFLVEVICNYFFNSMCIILYKSRSFMGNFCAPDTYRDMKEAYHQDFQKYIIGQQMKKSLKDRMALAQTKITASAQQIQINSMKVINSKEKQVHDHYKSVQKQIDKFYLGGINGLEQGSNVTIDQILQYDAIQQQYQGLKQQTVKKFLQIQRNTLNQLKKLENQEKEKINREQPKLDLFEQLPDKLKSDVYNKGVKEYQEKIKNQTTAFLAPLEKKLATENFTQRFDNLLSVEAIKSITKKSKSNLDKRLEELIGNSSEIHACLF